MSNNGVIIFDNELPTVQHVVSVPSSSIYTPAEEDAAQVYPALKGEKGDKGDPGNIENSEFSVNLDLIYQVSKL